jgi:hemoglobin-like flavoprotein
MIDKLLKHNEKLNKIIGEAQEELDRQSKIIDDALSLKSSNMSQVEKLQSFIGKEDIND